MAVKNAARTPGAEWKAIVGKRGAKESTAAFASNAVLETSVMNGPCVGAETIASVFAAVAGGMYDSLTFTSETAEGRKTYLEWEGKAFGKDVGGATDPDPQRSRLDRKRPLVPPATPNGAPVFGRTGKTLGRKGRSKTVQEACLDGNRLRPVLEKNS